MHSRLKDAERTPLGGVQQHQAARPDGLAHSMLVYISYEGLELCRRFPAAVSNPN